jgi:hypothetical protein
MFGWWRRLSSGIENWRAFHNYRRLLVSRKMCYGGLVDSTSRVDIDRIDHFVERLRILL